jgi:hypothetical protein
VLGYFRRAAAAGKWADGDDVPDEQFVFDFLYRHGQSSDWVFRGDMAGMVCRLASLSNPSADGPDPNFAAIEAHRAATADVIRAEDEEKIHRAADRQDEASEAILGVIPTITSGAEGTSEGRYQAQKTPRSRAAGRFVP